MTQKRTHFWPWLIGFSLFVIAIYMVKGILMPFLTGFLVAYALNPGVRCLERYGLKRGLGSIFLILSFFIGIGALLFIAIPFLQTELSYLATRVPQYGERILETLKPLLDDVSLYIEPTDLSRLREMASNYLIDVITWAIKLIVSILTNGLALANLIALAIITPIVAFYFLRDWNTMLSTLDHWLPKPYANKIRQIIRDIDDTIGGFAKGQATVCIVLALFYCTALTLVDLDFSIIVGLVIGVLAFIPYVGAVIGFMLSIGIALSQFSEWSSIGLVVSVFFVGQIIEGYLLVPYLVGNRIGLHPIWVIFAILAGGVLYGFVGILVALPVAATLGVLGRHGLKAYMNSSYYLGKAPATKTQNSGSPQSKKMKRP